MKTVNFNFEINDLNGSPIGNAGKLIGGLLMADNKGDSLKFYDWAIAFHKGEQKELDLSDFKKVYEFIENCEKLTNISKAQLLIYLNSLK